MYVKLPAGFKSSINKMHKTKRNKTQTTKYNSCLVPTPTGFGTKMQSSGILMTTKDLCFIVYCLVQSIALYTERKEMHDFYIHGSLHRESNLIIVLQDATAFSLLYFCRQLYMFWVLTHICNYSFWHWLTGSTTFRCSGW